MVTGSGSSTFFALDTRNYTDAPEIVGHTDSRAYLETDTVPGSLRQAMANAAPGGTVDFDEVLSEIVEHANSRVLDVDVRPIELAGTADDDEIGAEMEDRGY